MRLSNDPVTPDGRKSGPRGTGEVGRHPGIGGVMGDVTGRGIQYCSETPDISGTHPQSRMYNPHAPGWVIIEQMTKQTPETYAHSV